MEKASATQSQTIISVSPNAASYMLRLLKNEPAYSEKSGVRIQMQPGGCSGLKYDFEYAIEPGLGDIIEEHHGLRFFIPGAWTHFLRGTTIDHVEQLSGSGFQIENPNTKRSCGCGKSVS